MSFINMNNNSDVKHCGHLSEPSPNLSQAPPLSFHINVQVLKKTMLLHSSSRKYEDVERWNSKLHPATLSFQNALCGIMNVDSVLLFSTIFDELYLISKVGV